jgi:2-oxoglutarate ferredoxin oxidoreductase subunit gamma
MTKNIFIAGFGGQGILFTGKFLAYAGMLQGFEVTWLPSYGAESRGGTSNCGVVISDRQVGSPVVLNPDILICMNNPSLIKFGPSLAKGGKMFVNSSLCETKTDDADTYNLPVTQMAFENGLGGLANMIMTGFLIKECDLCKKELIEQVMKKVISERKKDMFDSNLKAINIGLEYTPEGR